MEIINWRIVGHPLNWLTVVLMVFIGGLAVHFVLGHLGVVPASQQSST